MFKRNKIKYLAGIILLPLIFLLSFPMTIFADTEGAWTYTDNGENITINGYDAAIGGNSVEIPNTILSKPVSGLSDYSFFGKTSITGVSIPGSVIYIGNSVFDGCTSLSNAVIGNSVSSIGIASFARCSALGSIIIPASVTSIGSFAFYSCTILESIIIPESVSNIGDQVFSGVSENLIIYGYSGSYAQSYAESNSITFVALIAEEAPTASEVHITGNATIGETLTGNYTYNDANEDAEGTSLFRWLESESEDGEYFPVSEAVSNTLLLTTGQLNKYIKFEVTPVSLTGDLLIGNPVLSAATNKVEETAEDPESGEFSSDQDGKEEDGSSEKNEDLKSTVQLNPEELVLKNLSNSEQVELYGSSSKGFIQTLYDNILVRVPDEEGLNYWVKVLEDKKISPAEIVYLFVFSEELHLKLISLTDEEFVAFLYNNVFNREEDLEGYESWISVMRSGASKEEVLINFLDTEEFENYCKMFGL